MSVDEKQLAVMEAQAKLNLRVARAVIKQCLQTAGNVLLVTWLFAFVALIFWFLICPILAANSLVWDYVVPTLRADPEALARINALGMMLWDLVAGIFFLLPGLALRVCAQAMGKP